MAEIATNRTSSSDYSGEFFYFLALGFFLLFGLFF